MWFERFLYYMIRTALVGQMATLRFLTNGGKLSSEIQLMIYLLGITTVVDIAVSLFYCTHNNALLLQYCIWVKSASKNLLLFYPSCQ